MKVEVLLGHWLARVSPIWLVVISILSVQVGTAIAIHLFHAVPASGAAFYNAFFSALVLGSFSWRAKIQWHTRNVLLVLGFGFSIAGMFLSFFYAVELIPMAIGSTIEFMGPLALSVLFARRASHFFYIFLAMAGVLALAPELGTSLNRLGVVYAVLSAVFWATFVLLSPRISKAFEGESGLAIGMAIACAFIFPFAWLDNGLGSVAPNILLGEFLMAFFSTILPLSLEYYALRRLSARSFGVLVSMEPAASALVAFVVLSQPIYPRMAVAVVAVTIAAIGITLSDARKHSS
ncbi:MAG: EamA family transporter [Pseudomonas sp.]|uniref:EamA family transporter n=1 Tax=Pseudomonas sp. TaxID=306 RepID=UPI003D0B3FB8